MEVFAIVAVVIVAILIRLCAGSMDHDRVRRYVAERGGDVKDATWAPFGPGWFGEQSDRIYAVRYHDADGNEHEAHCKTSLNTGVYFTLDNVVRRGTPRSDSPESLREENRQLREELARMRNGRN